MYLSAEAVIGAIRLLKAHVHPFVGITFIACKHHGLAVGSTETLSLDSLTRRHLDEHHQIDRGSSHYFQPFTRGSQWWVTRRYPSSGLQTTNTQTFSEVFLHTRNTQEWGFANNYLEQILSKLRELNYTDSVPADAMAAWLFKNEDLGEVEDYSQLTDRFFDTYKITSDERESLFSKRLMIAEKATGDSFVPEPLSMNKVARQFRSPPDAEVEGGRTITSLRLVNAGPSREMRLDFGERLSVITGDNGLGKSFLLDFAWWAATGGWAERPAFPQLGSESQASVVEYTLRSLSGSLSAFKATFDRKTFLWVRPAAAMTVEALAVFSRADGSFAIADPFRKPAISGGTNFNSLSSQEVWNGRQGVIEGLIRDWTKWQVSSDRKSFDRFSSVLKRLSPEDLGELSPGQPVRIPGDPREIPTIRHRYGVVPVTQASSGVQRVLLLAYLIIWSWQEHELVAEQTSSPPLHRMLVIVDELEAHLHPKWQRIVLPALMSVGDLLSSELALQMIAATHSPMILASMETTFDPETDVLYHLYGDGPEVKLEETPFVKYGDASGWLTSPLFGLRHARSREAERAIEAAKALQLAEAPSRDAVAEVSERLKRHLGGDDKFWPRWLYFAEEHGVVL